MRISELLRTALCSLRANKKRSFLTIIGIMIGIAAVITIMGIGDGITQTMYDKFGNNTKQGQQSTEIYYLPDNENSTVNGFTQQDLTNIDNQFGGEIRRVRIEHETANLNTHADIGDVTKNVTVSLLKKPTTAIKLVAGRSLSANELATGQAVALMKLSLAKRQYGTAQNALGTTVTVGTTTYQVVGVYKNQAEYSLDGDQNKYGAGLLLPADLYYQGDAVNQGDTIKLTFDQGTDAGRISKRVAKYLKKNGTAANQEATSMRTWKRN